MTTDERMKILNMISEGKITAEEGAKLLNALNKQKKDQAPLREGDPRWLRVRVVNMHSGKEEVRVNLPISLVNVGLKMGARFIPDAEQDIVMEDLVQALSQGVTGKIVDVVDEDEGQRVEVFLE